VSAGSNESSPVPPLLWWVKLPVKHKQLTRVLKEWKTGCRTQFLEIGTTGAIFLTEWAC